MVTNNDYRSQSDDIVALKIELSSVRKDLTVISEKVIQMHNDLEKIRSYFTKTFLGVGMLVLGYVVKWVLSGGLVIPV